MQTIVQADVLRISRAQTRQQLLDVGVVSVSFRVSGQDGRRTARLLMEDAEGILVDSQMLREQVARTLTAHVDAEAPGWDQGDGGRSEMNWAVQYDSLDHRHYDVVRMERNRVLKSEHGLSHSGDSLAESAVAAVLVAMGDLAPKQLEHCQSLRAGLFPLIEAVRSDQVRFLKAAQREVLLSAIVGNLVSEGDVTEDWIGEVVRDGHIGLEIAPDARLVQELATLRVEDLVERMLERGEPHEAPAADGIDGEIMDPSVDRVVWKGDWSVGSDGRHEVRPICARLAEGSWLAMKRRRPGAMVLSHTTASLIRPCRMRCTPRNLWPSRSSRPTTRLTPVMRQRATARCLCPS